MSENTTIEVRYVPVLPDVVDDAPQVPVEERPLPEPSSFINENLMRLITNSPVAKTTRAMIRAEHSLIIPAAANTPDAVFKFLQEEERKKAPAVSGVNIAYFGTDGRLHRWRPGVVVPPRPRGVVIPGSLTPGGPPVEAPSPVAVGATATNVAQDTEENVVEETPDLELTIQVDEYEDVEFTRRRKRTGTITVPGHVVEDGEDAIKYWVTENCEDADLDDPEWRDGDYNIDDSGAEVNDGTWRNLTRALRERGN